MAEPTSVPAVDEMAACKEAFTTFFDGVVAVNRQQFDVAFREGWGAAMDFVEANARGETRG